MNDRYLLEELYKKAKHVRTAQRRYYSLKAPFADPMKRSHLQESQRREVDLDRLIAVLEKSDPKLAELGRDIR